MYTPASFAITDPEQLVAFIAEHSFGIVVTQQGGIPIASHLPLLHDRERGELGTLVGHLARANPQWKDAEDQAGGIPVLAIFSGPHTYISPTWYGEPNTVPTWNYVTVHATGRLKLIHNPERLLALLGRTVEFYEAPLPQPWRLEDQDQEFIQKLLSGIVGFEIEIQRLEGKWKLNQNQSTARRERVINVLEQSPRHDDRAVAEWMRRVGT